LFCDDGVYLGGVYSRELLVDYLTFYLPRFLDAVDKELTVVINDLSIKYPPRQLMKQYLISTFDKILIHFCEDEVTSLGLCREEIKDLTSFDTIFYDVKNLIYV
jgi:hypothetical protein